MMVLMLLPSYSFAGHRELEELTPFPKPPLMTPARYSIDVWFDAEAEELLIRSNDDVVGQHLIITSNGVVYSEAVVSIPEGYIYIDYVDSDDEEGMYSDVEEW